MSFTVYRSSAGSGKTYTLVKEYLKIALGSEAPDTYRAILAITFTNKAANEMKERVLHALQDLSQDGEPAGNARYLVADIRQELALDPDAIRQRARKVLTHLLHHYADFSISTIDKFVHRIIRTFAHDMNIPLNFEVELNTRELLTTAIDLLIARIGEQEDLTRALVEFTELKAEAERSWHIEADLLRFAQNLMTENGQLHLEKLKAVGVADFFRVKAAMDAFLAGFEERMRGIGQQALDRLEKAGIDPAALAGGKNGIGAYFRFLAEFRTDKLVPSATVQSNIENGKWHATRATPDEKAAIEGLSASLAEAFREAQQLLETDGEKFHLYELIHRNIYSLAVINELEKIIDDYKRDNNILHISEFNQRIGEIVAHEPAPYIYERLGERYRHYLIDEFQDTSVLQWQNLLPLIDHSLASGHANLLVGDGKQSIYRWRGGEVEQFARLPELAVPESHATADAAHTLKQHYKEAALQANYRSKTEIVRFNNYFFRSLAQQLHEDYRGIYDGLEQSFNPENTGGYVMVETLGGSLTLDYQTETLDRIVAIIGELQQDGFAKQEITLLCRRNREASLIANHLLEHGIEVISSESLVLSQSEFVRFLVLFLRYLSDTQNPFTRSELVLQAARIGLIDRDTHEALAWINRKDSKFNMELFFHEKGYDLRIDRLIQLPIYETVETVVRLFDLHERVNPYITFFLEFVYTYTSRQNNNLGEFIELWESRMDHLSIVVPEGTDAVQVMTIHKSKGLEFPAVIFPFANWPFRPSRDDLWVTLDEEELEHVQAALVPTTKTLEQTEHADAYTVETNKSLLDNINLLYVAFTRPSERLYVLTSEPDKGVNFSRYFLEFLTRADEWDNAQDRFTFGEPVPHRAEQALTNDNLPLPRFISQNWREKLQMSRQANALWDADEPNLNEAVNLLHAALHQLASTNDIPEVVAQLEQQGIATTDEAQALEAQLQRLLSEPAIAPYFLPGLRVRLREDLLLPEGDPVTPDRVIEDGHRALVLQYKSGIANERDKKRLSECGRAVRELGFAEVENLLVYTDRGMVEVVG